MPQSTKIIKNRIKSVESTKQITKAMELVATSKMRKAKDSMERIKPYFNSLCDIAKDIMENSTDFSSPFCKGNGEKPTCHIIIAGDRGLAADVSPPTRGPDTGSDGAGRHTLRPESGGGM